MAKFLVIINLHVYFPQSPFKQVVFRFVICAILLPYALFVYHNSETVCPVKSETCVNMAVTVALTELLNIICWLLSLCFVQKEPTIENIDLSRSSNIRVQKNRSPPQKVSTRIQNSSQTHTNQQHRSRSKKNLQ